MRLFSKTGGIVEDRPETSGKVIVNIDVRRIDRTKRRVKIIVAATWAAETLFRAEYETESRNDVQAVTQARIIAETFCKHEDYIITSVDTTGAELPVIQTVAKGGRW